MSLLMNLRTTVRVTFGLLCVAGSVAAQSPRLSFTPAQPQPGALVRITLRTDSTSRDTAMTIRGTMAGEPLHFRRAGKGVWRAAGPVPVDASDSVSARVVVRTAEGVDTVRGRVLVPKIRVVTSRLSVDTSFTKPPDSATVARIARENERARDAGRHAHETPRQWTQPFLRPRTTTVTSPFGSGRLFNGALTSRHLGVDFRGATGEPVLAANRGIVAIVDTFFLAGGVVYIDHGEGVLTGYFHMSKTLVKEGDVVERGQEIGLVGATGRVTGPHLHWSARYGAQTVNPLDLLPLR